MMYSYKLYFLRHKTNGMTTTTRTKKLSIQSSNHLCIKDSKKGHKIFINQTRVPKVMMAMTIDK